MIIAFHNQIYKTKASYVTKRCEPYWSNVQAQMAENLRAFQFSYLDAKHHQEIYVVSVGILDQYRLRELFLMILKHWSP